METGLEHSSLPALKCGFCRHDNPAGSRFCNACGAPVAAEPCPDCGTVNEATATACQRCGASLGGGAENDFFLPLPPEATSASQPEEAHTEAVPAARAAAAVEFESPDDNASLIPKPALGSGSMGNAAMDKELSSRISPAPTSPVAIPLSTGSATSAAVERIPARSAASEAVPMASAAVAGVPYGLERSGSSGRTLTWGFVLVAMAVAAYFAYQHFHRWQPGDAGSQPTSAREATGRAIPAVPDKSGSEPAVAAKPAAPSMFAPDREPQAVSQMKATGGGGADTRGSHGGDHAVAGSTQPQPAPDQTSKADAGQRRSPSELQEAPKTPATRADGADARLAERAGATAAQRPSDARACTDGLAALALCKPEKQ